MQENVLQRDKRKCLIDLKAFLHLTGPRGLAFFWQE